jgi:hypothetical protein
MSRTIEFLVIGEAARRLGARCIRAAGRCFDGPILVGDHFREARYGDRVASVDLVVEEIWTYGKLLDELDPGLTGELVLSGELSEPLADHAVLAGKDPLARRFRRFGCPADEA